MNKSQRLKLLIEKGYFPDELPPPFVTSSLARYRSSILSEWSKLGAAPKTQFESYSFPRIGRKRRTLAVVNPISQMYLAKEVADSWVEINRFVEQSRISLDPPVLGESSQRAIPRPDFGLISLKKVDTGASYNHVLVSDISRFYGTIYTHSIPWALHTKAVCKANLNNKAYMKTLVGDRLDTLVRKGQDNQTQGIPVGPDTSRIISELLAVAIEKRFIELARIEEGRVFRYVDDWFIGFDGAGEAEDAIAFLSKACAEFGLELNDEKTRILDPIEPVEDLWPEELKQHRFSRSARPQGNDIRHFFTKAFHFASEMRNKNVLDFAIKRARSITIAKENVALFESYVIRTARINSVSLPTAVQILVNIRDKGHVLDNTKLTKLIEDTIKQGAIAEMHGEVAWALFLAKGLSIHLQSHVFKPVLELESSVCALLGLDLINLGLVEGTPDTSFWQSFMNKGALSSSMWLLAYEAAVKGWLPAAGGYVASHPHFGVLEKKGVHFYDERKNVPTFERSLEVLRQENLRKKTTLNALQFRIFNQPLFQEY